MLVSLKTADRHVQNAYRKIGVSTRAAVTLFAMQHGLATWENSDFPHRRPFVASFPAGNVDEQQGPCRADLPAATMKQGARMNGVREPGRAETVVVGAGQAGLSVGHHLARRGLPFVILDAHARIGDSWRNRWDSLRLFTPARYNGLTECPSPARSTPSPPRTRWPTTSSIYAARFDLPVRTGVEVDGISRNGHGGARGDGRRDAVRGRQRGGRHVHYQRPRVPRSPTS